MPRAISPSGPLSATARPAAGRPCMVSRTCVVRLVMPGLPFSSRHPPDQPHPADSAIGDDVQPDEADCAEIGQIVAKDVNLIRLELRFGQKQRPALGSGRNLLGRASRARRRLEEAAIRIIAFEMSGIDDDFLGLTRRTQLQYRPVVPGLAPS